MTQEEGRRLQKITKTSKQPIRTRRAIVVMASAQHQPRCPAAMAFSSAKRTLLPAAPQVPSGSGPACYA